MAVMGALKDLWQSERGLVAVALIIATTALYGTGHLSVEQWTDMTKWIFVTYVAAKTVTGAVAMATKPSSPAPPPVDDDLLNRILQFVSLLGRPGSSSAPSSAPGPSPDHVVESPHQSSPTASSPTAPKEP
jgi:hypothetical protein